MTRPLVTVLTAVRNGAEYLPATLESIRSQTFEDWEMVVVDDASDDATPEILARFQEADDRFKLVVRREQGGPFVAANQGLELARGRYVVRTDADDVSGRTRIERQVCYLENNPGLRACGSYWQLLSPSGVLLHEPRVIQGSPRTLKWRLCVRGGPAHSSLCAEREALVKVGGYRELPVAQDYRLLCDLSRRDWLGIVPEVLVFYRRHPSQLGATSSGLQQRLAAEALQDHIERLLGEAPSLEQVRYLHRLGESPGLLDRYRSLRTWVRWWSVDPQLTADDRAALRDDYRVVRRVILRDALRRWGSNAPVRFLRRGSRRLLSGGR